MNLYELTGASKELQDMLESGEIDKETYEDTLSSLDIDTKIESICYVIKNLEALAVACKAEEEKLATKRKMAENGVKRLKESLLCYMGTLNKKKVKAGLFTVTKTKSESLTVLDETAVPEEFLIYQPAKINKQALKKSIKDGAIIAGAVLEEKEYVRIK